ncbi:SYCP2_SLD domain-containing protein [Trichonephila clavata]|uniref:SYCP2_SLD domain-containing protein n=1 Tax=Trichonephila clavata TaxID=2740835 RepID=A0A8X6KUA7_TRICU|nr:SYCP2_SLD domain-containing protein [Trichonephila clavata]
MLEGNEISALEDFTTATELLEDITSSLSGEQYTTATELLEDITSSLSGEQYTTASAVLPLYMKIKNNLQNKDEDSSLLKSIKSEILESLNKYESHPMSSNLQLSPLCDPRFRLNFIESPEEVKKLAVAKMRNIYTTQKTSNPDNFENIETRTKEQNKKGLAKFFYVFGSNSNSENTRNPSRETEKELNEYLSMPRVSFEHDPLDWWKVHYESFLFLKVLARKYLCIQGSSVASERVFGSVENKNQEEKSPKEDKNEYPTKMKSARYEPKRKRLKRYDDCDFDYSPGTRFERLINESAKETISPPFSTRKPRMAAVNATRMNKTILKQKTPEKGSEICNFNQSSKSHDNFQKIEENISTPTNTTKKPGFRKSEDNILTPTKTEKSPRLRMSEENILTPTRTAKKPRLRKSEENILTPSKTAKKPRLKNPSKIAKKPRLRKSEENILTPSKTTKKPRLKNSVFTTDTETGSSEVSWFGQKRSYLFETPKKSYSNLRNKQETKDSHSRQRTYKSRNTVSGSKKKQNLVSLFPVLKPKNTLSDLENYELLIERKSNYKRASNFNQDNLRTTENMLDTLEVHDFEEKSNIEDNNNNQVYSNIEARIRKTSNHNTEEEWDIQDVEDKDYFTSEAMKQTEITNDNLSPNLTVEVNMNKGQLKQAISNKVKSGSLKLSNPKKNINNEDLHFERVSEQSSLSSSTKKRKSNDFPTFNKGLKKVKRNDNAVHHISLDTITNSIIISNAYAGNESLLGSSNSSNKVKGDFSEVSNNYLPKVPVSTKKDSPITTKSNRCDVMYSKKKSKSDDFIPAKDMLVTSLNNEKSGKRLHMQRFLEGLSGDSNSPKDIQYGKEKAELTSVTDSMHLKKRTKHFASINDSKKSPCGLNSERTSETDCEELPLLENYSNYWSPDEKIDNHKRICKTKEKKRLKSFAILNLLASEVNNLTRSLLGTLQKCSRDFSAKVASLRENIHVTASALVSEDSELTQKDLKNFARACKQNRIHAEKSLKKMLSVGQEYFEAEKRHEHKMKQLYRKAVEKYASKIETAERIATKALEEKIISKTDTFLKNIVKKIDNL